MSDEDHNKIHRMVIYGSRRDAIADRGADGRGLRVVCGHCSAR